MGMQERFDAQLAEFTQEVSNALEGMEKGKGVRTLASLFDGFQRGVEGMSGEDLTAAADQLGVEFLTDWQTFLSARDEITNRLGKVSGLNRDHGNALAKSMRDAVDGEWIEDDEVSDRVSVLLQWWNESAPKTATRGRPKSEGGQAARAATLGFTVRIKCEKDGHVTTDSTDLNSARHGALLHYKAAYGERPKKGSALWQGLTDALTAVIENGSQSAQGGHWIVDRAAA